MSSRDWVRITSEPLDLQAVVDQVSKGQTGAGAVSTFLGLTRDNFQGKEWWEEGSR